MLVLVRERRRDDANSLRSVRAVELEIEPAADAPLGEGTGPEIGAANELAAFVDGP